MLPVITKGINREENINMEEVLEKRYFNHIIRILVGIIDSRDPCTRGHSEKVMKHTAKIARILNLEKNESTKIKIAALLHDIGKYTVDSSILNKPGRLNEKEWQEIKKHPGVGAKTISVTGFLRDIVDVVLYHHCNFGGGGYPDPDMKGENIPLGSRVILVADAYDAMTSDRPYRPRPMTKREAIMELKRCSETQFDPTVVSAFLRTLS